MKKKNGNLQVPASCLPLAGSLHTRTPRVLLETLFEALFEAIFEALFEALIEKMASSFRSDFRRLCATSTVLSLGIELIAMVAFWML